MVKCLSAICCAVWMLCVFGVTAAAHEVPDLNKNGTVTFTMDWDGIPLDSGRLSMYKVGEIVDNDGSYSFELIGKRNDKYLSPENLGAPDLAKELAWLAKAEKLTERSAPIQDGEASFSDVIPGLYVVVQAEEDAADGFAPIDPFLISMPKFENGSYEYRVKADPKVPLQTAPQETTQPPATEPKDSQLPQTGLRNWPVPLLAVSGLVLFAASWMLCFGRKKEGHGKESGNNA